MSEKTAHVCAIVAFRLSQDHAEQINRRRLDASDNYDNIRAATPGYQTHLGKTHGAGDIVPMIVVEVSDYGHIVAGQCLLNGSDSLWAPSASRGDGPGQWSWPQT